MVNKRGLSEVVTTVLIVLLALAAVAIIWAFISPTIEQSGETIEREQQFFQLRYSIVPNSVTVNGSSGSQNVILAVRREAGASGATNTYPVIVLENDGGQTFVVNKTALVTLAPGALTLSEFESALITISQSTHGLSGNIKKIYIYPAIENQAGEEILGSTATGVHTVPSGGTPGPGPQCGDDGACDVGETASSCPLDCPADCGDGFITHTETCDSGVFRDYGDGIGQCSSYDSGEYSGGNLTCTLCAIDTTYCTLSYIPLTACGQPINVVGATYRLMNNISTSGTCFTIGADGITIDGQGYTITGPGIGGTEIAVNAISRRSIVMKNLVITNFNKGIEFSGTTNSRIEGNTISSTNWGISIFSLSTGNTIINNTLNSNTDGIRVGSNTNTIEDNMISDSSLYGINVVGGTSGTIIRRNIAQSTVSPSSQGLRLFLTQTGITIENNNFCNNVGLDIYCSTTTSSISAATDNKFLDYSDLPATPCPAAIIYSRISCT